MAYSAWHPSYVPDAMKLSIYIKSWLSLPVMSDDQVYIRWVLSEAYYLSQEPNKNGTITLLVESNQSLPTYAHGLLSMTPTHNVK